MADKILASSKTYEHSVGLSCCYRQWRADSHCRLLHGYALQVSLEFRATNNKTDKNGWVMDFGGLKDIKQWLIQVFDHKVLVAEDDPYKHMFLSMQHDEGIMEVMVVKATGCEAFANMIFDHIDCWLCTIHEDGQRVYLYSVRVSEHPGNSAIIYRGAA